MRGTTKPNKSSLRYSALVFPFRHSKFFSAFTRITVSLTVFALIIFSLTSISASPSFSVSSFSSRFSLTDSVNIAYFIQVVPASLPHFPRLFRRVYHPDNTYGLHFDVKILQADVDKLMAQIQSSIPTFRQNTHLVPSDVIVYNGVSMVLNTLAALTFLLDASDQWQFFINLSGNDYPLTEAYLPRQLLAQALPFSPIFLSLGNESMWMERFKIRADYLHFDPSLSHSLQNPELLETDQRNPILPNIAFTPVHAEAWMILPRSFCHFLIHSPIARRMLLSVANMRGSDEFFFSTLAYNHPEFNKSIVPHSFRKVIWKLDGKHAGQHPYYIDEYMDGQWVFLNELRDSPQLHARKFLQSDSALMDYIDAFANHPDRVVKTRREFSKAISILRKKFAAASNNTDAFTSNHLLT